jgi:hypothetical protein
MNSNSLNFNSLCFGIPIAISFSTNNYQMKTNFYKSFFLAVATSSFAIVSAQTTLKMGSLGGPSGTGPAISYKAVTLYENGTTTYNSMLTVTYSLTNQQYGPGAVEGMTAASMMNFGGDLNSSSNSAIGTRAFYTTMNAISNPTNSMFKACVNCNNSMDVTKDNAISLFSCTDAFLNATTGANAKALNARVYTGNLTITFNQPVTNPVLQIVGLGGITSVRPDQYQCSIE